MKKRLFIFAGFDKDGIVDGSLLHYLNALSELGDVVFHMDNESPESEMAKVREIPNVLHATAVRHSEYDFGSYKRGFMWAKDKNILKDYELVYFANDSVFGPFRPLDSILQNLESYESDVIGMCKYSNDDSSQTVLPAHIQSWFFGLNNKIVNGSEFFDFISNIESQDDKMKVVYKYEGGLGHLIRINKWTTTFFMPEDRAGFDMLEKPISMLTRGMPFVKKQSFRLIPDINIISAFTFDKIFLENVFDNIKRNEIKIGEKYLKKYRLTILGLPVFTVYKKFDDAKYKVLLFDKLPIIIIYNNKDVK